MCKYKTGLLLIFFNPGTEKSLPGITAGQHIIFKQYNYPVNDYDKRWYTQPMRMQRVFDIAMQQPCYGVPYATTGAPFKPYQPERAKYILRRLRRIAKTQRNKRSYPEGKLEIFAKNLLNQPCLIWYAVPKLHLKRLKRQ